MRSPVTKTAKWKSTGIVRLRFLRSIRWSIWTVENQDFKLNKKMSHLHPFG